MNKTVIIIFCVLFLGACCTKKGCPGEILPFIKVSFSNLDPENYDIDVYTFRNGKAVGFMMYSSDGPFTLENQTLVFYPYSNHDVSTGAGLMFVIQRENRSDTIRDFYIEFKQEKIVCNKCFPFGSEKEIVWNHDNFSYKVNSRIETTTDLVLPY